MERIYNCVNCTKRFEVKTEAKRSDLAGVPDDRLSVPCPFCRVSQDITWPREAKYIVVPAE